MSRLDSAKALFGKSSPTTFDPASIGGYASEARTRHGIAQEACAGKAFFSVLLDGSDEPVELYCELPVLEGQRVTVALESGTYKVLALGEVVELSEAVGTAQSAADAAKAAAEAAQSTADSAVGAASDAQDAADAASEAAAAAQEAADAAQEAANKNASDMASLVTSFNADIANLQTQVDGSITTWFYEVEPTSANEPTVNWTTDEDRNNHLGDLYYDTVTGYCYRYQVKDNAYSWQRITDTDVTKALENAQTAQDTADSKRRVFYATPTPPYDMGDLWVQGEGGDIMRCQTAKASGQSYLASDWVLASKYTDDTAANEAQSSADAANEAIKSLVSNVDVLYASSTSETTAPTSGWNTVAPAWVDGKYIWQKTVTTYGDGSTSESDPTCITGATGASGSDGSAGRGIASVVEQYYKSTSATSQSGGSWSTASPTWEDGFYIWTRSVITFDDGSSTTTTPICATGSKGETGDTGKSAYQVALDNGYSGSESEWLASLVGKDGESGAAGAAGADGRTPYLHIAYGTSLAGASFSTTYFDGATHMGTCTDYNSSDPTTASSYTWALIKGDKGDTGDAGADGKMLFAQSQTVASTTAKTASLSSGTLTLESGATVAVTFRYSNTAASPTLNVSGTGAKAIMLNGSNSAYWKAGDTVSFVYDGSYWQVCSTPIYGSTAAIGNPAGGNVYIDGDSVDVRSGGTLLASFAATLVELGKNAASAVIKLCGGAGIIQAYDTSDSAKGVSIYGGSANAPSLNLSTSGASLRAVGVAEYPSTSYASLNVNADGTIDMEGPGAERPLYNDEALALLSDVEAAAGGDYLPRAGGTMEGSILASGSIDLGSDSARWSNVYAKTIYLANADANYSSAYKFSLRQWDDYVAFSYRDSSNTLIGDAWYVNGAGNTTFAKRITQGSPSSDSTVASMNRFQTDVFVEGDGSAPNIPQVAGFYLGKSAADGNRHLDIVSADTYSYIDFNKAYRGYDYDVRLLVNVENGYTDLMWGTSGYLTQKVLNVQGSILQNGSALALQSWVEAKGYLTALPSHTHSYLPLSGGAVSGSIDFSNSSAWLTPYLLAFKNADTSVSPTYPYTGFYQWGNEWQVNARDANNNWAKNVMAINLVSGVANFVARPTVNGSQVALLSDVTSGGSVDLSGYAKLRTYNDFLHDNNEFTTVPDAYSGDIFWNYRTGAGNTNGNIGNYRFCNGKGGTAGVTLHADAFSGTAARATADADGLVFASVYAKKSNLNSYLLKSGDTMTGTLMQYVTGNPYYGLNDGTTNWYLQAVQGEGKVGLGPTWASATKWDASGNMAVVGGVSADGAISAGGKLSASGGAHISGRYYGAGDDEGLIIGRASNSYAGVTLGANTGVHATLYLMPDNSTVWRWNNGSASYDIKHPGKSGTVALTSDIPSLTVSGSVLYNNSSGTTGTVPLSSSAANFSFLEIQYTDGARYMTRRVYSPNGKNTTIERSVYDGSNYMYINSVLLTISGTAITQSNHGRMYGKNQSYPYTDSDASLKVVQVIGWN